MKIDFEFTTKYGRFSDAIWFPDDAPMTDEEIEAEKKRRLSNWIAIIEAPAEPEA
jgi:hypothetical protein